MKELNIHIDVEKRFLPKAEYVFAFFCKSIGVKPNFLLTTDLQNIHVYYGVNPNNACPVCIHHNPKAALFYDEKRLYPNDEIDFFRHDSFLLPFLFSDKVSVDQCLKSEELKNGVLESSEIYKFLGDRLIIQKDIISSAFYFLSCWQEYVEGVSPEHGGRYDYKKSLQYLYDFAEVPVVDIYSRIFSVGLERALVGFKRESSTFTLSLSHDIDYFDFWTRKQLYSIYGHNLQKFQISPLSAIYKGLGHLFTKQFAWKPEKVLERIYQKEERLKCQSTSFIMVKSDGKDERQAYFSDAVQREKIKRVYANRPVGLHGSVGASFDLAKLTEEINLLKSAGFEVKGYRNHYLCFDYQKSFSILEQAGIEYDCTLGFWETIGYRAGTSMPFYPYNIEEERAFNVLEIPLIAMDVSLFSPKAMNLSYHQAKLRLFSLIYKAATMNTHVSLLWHNNSFDFIDYPLWGRLYWEAIKYAKKLGGQIYSE